VADTTQRPYRFDVARRSLICLLGDLSILAGDIVGPSDVTVQAVLNTAIVNAEVLLKQLRAAQDGRVAIPPLVFPSPTECMDHKEEG
jgi:hypothetical protein